MGIRRWLVACTRNLRGELADAIAAYCGKNDQLSLEFFDSASELRRGLAKLPGSSVAVGPLGPNDISDVNLAAALVRDGRAASVMLVRKRVSGSLMSRARQAGVSLVAEIRDEGTFLYSIPSTADMGGDCMSDVEKAGSASLPSEPSTPVPATRKQRTLEEGKAPIVVVASGRGGVGKSTVAGLLALQAKAWGMRVALVDLDLAQGNLRSYLGEGRQGLLTAEAAKRGDVTALVFDALAQAQAAEHGMAILGPCEKPEDADVVAPIVGSLLDTLSGEVDLVVVDSSNTVTDAMAEAMQAADRLLLVSDDMPGGLAPVARLSGLAVRLGVARARIVRVINRCDPRQPPDLNAGRAEVGLEMARVHQLMEGGIDVCELEAEGQLAEAPKACRDLGASAATCLARLLGELGRLPDAPAAQEALEGGRKHRFLPFLKSKREAS